jgi:predicted nucleic acid-binding protein
LGAKVTGTIGILIKSVEMSIINHKEADKILHKMVGYGFYSPISSIKNIVK